MVVFSTPKPIDARIDLGAGDLRISATAQRETTVDVQPSDTSRPADVRAAESTRIEYDGGRLMVLAPKDWRRYSYFSGGSVDVRIELPVGSRVQADVEMGDCTMDGKFASCIVAADMGSIRVEQCASVRAKTGYGDITVGDAMGDVEASTGSGELRVDRAGGRVMVQNSNGETRIGEVFGDVRAKAANGGIDVDRPHRGIKATSAHGNIRVLHVEHGAVSAETSVGTITIGIQDGTHAWLDVSTGQGVVLRNSLSEVADAPPDGADTAQVIARTSVGDIVILRCADEPAGAAAST